MKFKVEQEELAKALNCMSKLMVKLPKDSPFNCVKFSKLNEEYIRLVASNSTTSIQYDIEAILIEGNQIIYDINYLTSIVNKLNGELTFDVDIVKDNKSKFKVGHKTQEYPYLNFESKKEKTTIGAKEFIEALNKTVYATTKDNVGVLSGVYLHNDNIVATDGNRLVINKVSNNNLEIILPFFTVEYISKLFEDDINIQCDNNLLLLSDKRIVITVNSLNGVYPKYENILPKDSCKTIKFNKSNMVNALNTMLPVLNQCNMIATFSFEGNTCNIDSLKGDYQGQTNFDLIETDEEKFEINFNCQYLLDLCKYLDDEEITMEFRGMLGPVVFKNNDTYSIIMPIQKK